MENTNKLNSRQTGCLLRSNIEHISTTMYALRDNKGAY